MTGSLWGIGAPLALRAVPPSGSEPSFGRPGGGLIALPPLGDRRSIRPESLANGHQRELQLPAEHGAHAQSAQQRLVHGSVE